MELSIRIYDRGHLEDLSFTEVYRAFAELMHRQWERQQIERHIARRVRRCCQKRRVRPDCVATLMIDDQAGSINARETAW